MTRKSTSQPAPLYPVRVVRSRKRKRTVSARIVDGVLELSVPSWLSVREEAEFVDRMQQRFARKKARSSTDLEGRSAALAAAYDLPRPSSIRWVSNQTTRWGSCTTSDASIRLSDRLQGMPDWVIDAVLVHELAHLVEADHGPAFKTLEARFPRQVEATAFLDGVTWARSHPLGEREEPGETEDETAPEAGSDGPVDPIGERRDGLLLAAHEVLPGDDSVELEGLDGGLDIGQLRLDLR